jgi:hypothetical protein
MVAVTAVTGDEELIFTPRTPLFSILLVVVVANSSGNSSK